MNSHTKTSHEKETAGKNVNAQRLSAGYTNHGDQRCNEVKEREAGTGREERAAKEG